MYIESVLDGTAGETYAKPQGRITVISFSDVTPGSFYFDSVAWATEKRITAGTAATAFTPERTCTDAEILAFLWRAMGSPDPVKANPFDNLTDEDAFYYKAALWAHEQGLVLGSHFEGDTPCTRASAVTYLWKACGSPETGDAAFTDVPAGADYAQAVAWAAAKEITAGTGTATFTPERTCTRSEIATFLYRCMAE